MRGAERLVLADAAGNGRRFSYLRRIRRSGSFTNTLSVPDLSSSAAAKSAAAAKSEKVKRTVTVNEPDDPDNPAAKKPLTRANSRSNMRSERKTLAHRRSSAARKAANLRNTGVGRFRVWTTDIPKPMSFRNQLRVMAVFNPDDFDAEKAREDAEKTLVENALNAENRKKNLAERRAAHADRRIRIKALYPHLQSF